MANVGGYVRRVKKAKLLHIVKRQGRPKNAEVSHWLNEAIDIAIEIWEREHGEIRLRPDLVEQVTQKIGERGAKLSRRKLEKRPPSFWQALDWSKRNKDIAEELNVAPQWVSVMRGRYGS